MVKCRYCRFFLSYLFTFKGFEVFVKMGRSGWGVRVGLSSLRRVCYKVGNCGLFFDLNFNVCYLKRKSKF